MMAATHPTLTTHVVRLVIALLLSLVTLVVLLFAVRAASSLQGFAWFVLPMSVAVGFIPIIRWYGRDAFPIGVIYCPAVFFLLRYLGEVIGRELLGNGWATMIHASRRPPSRGCPGLDTSATALGPDRHADRRHRRHSRRIRRLQAHSAGGRPRRRDRALDGRAHAVHSDRRLHRPRHRHARGAWIC